ncbi:CPBP family intramembrane glutamic endopeptidase [Virgibacillus alimentarius]|uniref:Membrane protease YdiL (CAAX protease family) n=1 Tax=Virgibacillus alimentarius TaxID=698769 RepID=A0ABS4S4S4_9BACI|nr:MULTISPECIES: type II CAAX endopeptidase family protein [Virgibacillus]MBP2256404.1 membrane protease YdiL (CAAX protease family) [Virgibacillus alimentarius]HLR66349.1 type II CAAX endopeptidase family protein [Virgibacillus sp.]
MKQTELIKQLTDDELKKQLILSQLFLIVLSLILSFFLFSTLVDWVQYFRWLPKEILQFGVFPGIAIVFIDLILMYIFPKRYYDDGGINERIFKNLSIKEIFLITLLIAISEELLFRGVIQTTFGYLFASILFALVHLRYLKKPVLLISVLVISFLIGYIFMLTENLFVTITTHFIVDFLLGIIIRMQKRGAMNE